MKTKDFSQKILVALTMMLALAMNAKAQKSTQDKRVMAFQTVMAMHDTTYKNLIKNGKYKEAIAPLTKLINILNTTTICQDTEISPKMIKAAKADYLYDQACCFALTKQKKLALSTLWKSVDSGYKRYDNMLNDNDLASLRKDKKYQTVMLAGCSVKPETLGDLASAYATVDDSIRVHYKQYGDGDKTICFVHGFGCDLNTWKKQFEGLRDEQNLRLVFIDLPGYGESNKPHVEYTLDFYAKAVNAVLDKEHVGAITLVGHSLGTPVCRQVLMRGRQGSLVDIDGVYCFYDGTEMPEYIEAVNQFGHAFDGPDCAKVIEGFVTSLTGPETPQSITDYAMSVMPETPQYVASSTMQHLIEKKWWPNHQITQPVMVICTQNSGLDPDNRQKMERLYPHLDYTKLTTCGHFIHMEQPDMFNEKLKKFCNKIEN